MAARGRGDRGLAAWRQGVRPLGDAGRAGVRPLAGVASPPGCLPSPSSPSSIAVVSAVIFGGFDVNVFGLDDSRSDAAAADLAVRRWLRRCCSLSRRARARSPRSRRDRRSPSSRSPPCSPCGCRSGRCRRPATRWCRASGFTALLYEYVPGFNGVRVPARYAMIAGCSWRCWPVTALRRCPAVGPAEAGRYIGTDVASGFRRTIAVGRHRAAHPGRRRGDPHGDESHVGAERSHAADACVSLPPRLRRCTPGWPRCRPGRPSPSSRSAMPRGRFATCITPPRTGSPSPTATAAAFRPDYSARVARLKNVTVDPDASWQSLLDSGSTHVVLHPGRLRQPGRRRHRAGLARVARRHDARIVPGQGRAIRDTLADSNHAHLILSRFSTLN